MASGAINLGRVVFLGKEKGKKWETHFYEEREPFSPWIYNYIGVFD